MVLPGYCVSPSASSTPNCLEHRNINVIARSMNDVGLSANPKTRECCLGFESTKLFAQISQEEHTLNYFPEGHHHL